MREMQTKFSRHDSGVSEILTFLQAFHSLGNNQSLQGLRLSSLEPRTGWGHCCLAWGTLGGLD